MKEVRTITEILSNSLPSYHNNITYHVKLSCGHVAIRTYKRGTSSPLKKRVVCHLCSNIDDFDKYRKEHEVEKQ